MEYNFSHIENIAKSIWQERDIYKTENNTDKPKFYVLDMFPYPSGAGLHVGHPLGYIASDIYSRYKRMKGYNVLHPMGFDAFGLPAEQYALETGQHPAKTTEQNISRYKEQLNKIGFDYDWSREIRTSDLNYYKWTQWIFLQLFNSWYDRSQQKARPIAELEKIFEKEGNINHTAPSDEEFKFDNWGSFNEVERRKALMKYRLAYLDYAEVWWCEALGTVLANDEVVNGVSERGGHPVEKKKMSQWFLRITEYADRLLESLDKLDWSEAMKEMQRNWIGKSEGAEITFKIAESPEKIKVFTTRPDTIFGVDFMVLAPEHELLEKITTSSQKEEVAKYVQYVKSRSERERMAEKKESGVFTGAYAIHPFTGKNIPIWISEYVLAGYGSGAIMAVPSGDDRDLAFAKHFHLPITNIFGELFTEKEAITDKNVTLHNSEALSGKNVKEAKEIILKRIEDENIGNIKTNYKLRDAGFSRQRYWGEPFPIVYKNAHPDNPLWEDIPYAKDELEANLPLELRVVHEELPFVESYSPGPEGKGPLANIEDFVNVQDRIGKPLTRETNTMPGYAGSSWYFLRYMDPGNDQEFVSKSASDYWNQVDLYVGGTEHAVGHLLYSRMWTKVLHDLGHLSFDEPFKRLLNQGMIQGSSRFVYRVKGENKFVSYHLKDQYETDEIRVDVSIVDGVEMDIDKFKSWRPEYKDAEFITENDKFITGVETEKMSKSKYNVVNPDEIVAQYGADTFRMYEMFLGPIEMSKPWDTKGIEGVYRFLRKFWRLFYDENGWRVKDISPSDAQLKILHRTIKKIEEDTERFSYNTAVSQFMICVNELTDAKTESKSILSDLVKLIAPYAPHTAEYLWQQLGNESSVVISEFPKWEEKYTIDNTKVYPIAINGKTKHEMEFALDAAEVDIKEKVMAEEKVQQLLDGKELKKFIFVKGRMINLVI